MLVGMGYLMVQDQHRIYNKYLHALRKQFMPESMGTDPFPFPVISMSFEQVFSYLVKFDAYLFMASGVFICSQSKAGPVLLIIATLFVLATRDNPIIASNLESIKQE
mmetsp:Transcript_17837/g.17072  ORF Transcript_17837/g.17072 Transcript_17837/m.17072 type:complete len:107 (+) Transcript_17837:3-323(+)